jgi:chromatin remodeling complex protein RSC6
MPAKKSTGKNASAKSTTTTKRAKKTSTKSTPAPVEEPAPVVETVAQVVETVAQVVETVTPAAAATSGSVGLVSAPPTPSSVGGEQLEADYQSLMDRLSEFKTLYTGITTDLRRLQKNMNRYIRDANKRSRRPKNTDPNRAKRPPSGFAKPALISNELCSFLGVQTGTEMARTEVTKHLTTYIKEHNLQDQENKRKILPDSKLQKLLNVTPSDEVTYFNLQKFMKVHFPKSAAAIAADAAAAAAAATASTASA